MVHCMCQLGQVVSDIWQNMYFILGEGFGMVLIIKLMVKESILASIIWVNPVMIAAGQQENGLTIPPERENNSP